jgi:hypothetical protein
LKEEQARRERNLQRIREEVEERKKKINDEEEMHIKIREEKHKGKRTLEEINQYMEQRNQKYHSKKAKHLEEFSQSLDQHNTTMTTTVSTA